MIDRVESTVVTTFDWNGQELFSTVQFLMQSTCLLCFINGLAVVCYHYLTE